MEAMEIATQCQAAVDLPTTGSSASDDLGVQGVTETKGEQGLLYLSPRYS